MSSLSIYLNLKTIALMPFGFYFYSPHRPIPLAMIFRTLSAEIAALAFTAPGNLGAGMALFHTEHTLQHQQRGKRSREEESGLFACNIDWALLSQNCLEARKEFFSHTYKRKPQHATSLSNHGKVRRKETAWILLHV